MADGEGSRKRNLSGEEASQEEKVIYPDQTVLI